MLSFTLAVIDRISPASVPSSPNALGMTMVFRPLMTSRAKVSTDHGPMTPCGLAGGMDFPSSVAPFILRGVTLAGIDSVMAPHALRVEAWARLARDLEPARLDAMTREIKLADAIAAAADILAGKIRGRLVVNVNA